MEINSPYTKQLPSEMTPHERDLAIRTILGEGGDDTGQETTARKLLGSPGNIESKVLARGGYKSWDTRAKELLSIDPTSERYKKAAALLDRVSSVPSAPAEEVAPGIVSKYTKKPTESASPPPQGTTLQIPGQPDFHPPVPPPAGAPGPAPVNVPQSFLQQSAERLTGGIARDVPKIAAGVAALPGNVLQSTAENFRGGVSALRTGGEEIRAGNILPSFPSTDPSTWQLGGGLRAPLGAVSAVLSPVSALTESAIENPVTQLTGNPEAGMRAGALANAFAPSPQVIRTASRFLPSTRALEGVSSVLQQAQPQAIMQRLAENPRLTLADVDPSLRQRAMGIATEPGPAKNQMFEAVQQRMASAPEAVREAYSSQFGEAPNVLETLRGYKDTARTNAAKGFSEAFADASHVDVSPVIRAIDIKLKPGITGVASEGASIARGPIENRLAEIRQQLTDGQSTLTDPQRLHEIQSELGREVRDLTSSATGSDKRLGREIGKVQQTLVDQIDEATGGKYRPARQQYRSDMEVQDAFGKGTQLLQNRGTMAGLVEDTPEAWREWRAGASPEELKAAQLGARAMIEQKIGGLRNAARQGTALPETEFNQQKFRILFGDREAYRLSQLLRDEKDIATTNSQLFGNSATAERLAGREAVRVRDVRPMSYSGLIPSALAELGGIAGGFPEYGHAAALGMGGMSAARAMAQRIGRHMDMRRNALEASILMAQGGQRESALRALSDQMNRARGPALRPTLPITYVPPDVREGR